MRFLFFLLLIVNGVFLAWKSGWSPAEWLGSGETEQTLVLPKEVTLTASTEQGASMWDNKLSGNASVDGQRFEDKAGTEDKVSQDPASVLLSDNGCYEMGPVRDKAVADSFVQLLNANAKDVSIATRSGSAPEGWWVLFPKASTLEAARGNRRLLESKGVIDNWLFETGPLRGAISLGFYKTREEAEQLAQQLRDKSVVVKIAPRLVRGDAFWVRFSWEGLPQDLEEVVRVLNSQDSALKMPMPSPCKL